MRFHKFVLSGLTALAGLAMAADANAGGRNPGSLLLAPEFDNRIGDVTVLTVTNTAASGDDILVEYVYLGRYDNLHNPVYCEEFNRTELFTPNDTLTLLTRAHNPQQEWGYVYMFAKDVDTGLPVAHNYLIGQVLTVSGINPFVFDYAINCVSYEGFTGDDNGNGLRDLDGVEYEQNAGEILIPRFFGQSGTFQSDLVFIGLTGGAAFVTTVDFLIYNDNEEVFSGEHSFYCWDRVPLSVISGVFDQAFLELFTNNDPAELFGANHIETGWFRMEGALASSTAVSFADPAIYAVLIERAGNIGAADLPFESGLNDSGALLARGVNGDL